MLSGSAPANAFLLCRWDEYFDRFTPDSYQPRLCHIPILVDEIALVATEAQKQSGWKKHLVHLRAELMVRLQDEPFFGVCENTDLAALQTLCRESDVAAMTTLARNFQFSHFKERYEKAAIERGRAELARLLGGDAKNKSAAIRWLGLWATIGLRRGYIYSDARQQPEMCLARSFTDNLDAIGAGLDANPRTFLCVVALLPVPSHDDNEPAGDRTPAYTQRVQAVLRKAGFDFTAHDWFPNRGINSREILLSAEEKGIGPIDALHRLVRRLQPALNLLGFYRGAPPAQVIRRGWAGPDRAHLNEHQIEPLLPRLQAPRKNAVELSVHTLGAWQSGRLDGPLANALELHNLAVCADDLRVQFVTMWSALESLTAVVPGPTVISRVTNLLLPIVTWRRLEKEVRYLAINIRLWRRAAELEMVKVAGLPTSRKNAVHAEDVLLAVTRPADHGDITSILSHVSPHPLLLWRTYATWKTFHDPQSLAKDMMRARERLTWHLWRIYRARNLLVHSGLETPLLSHLLSHLSFYLTTVISRLLHRVTHDASLDAEKAAAYWGGLSDRVANHLVSNPSCLTLGDLMTNPKFRGTERPWVTDR
jgi:hypothetical protein